MPSASGSGPTTRSENTRAKSAVLYRQVTVAQTSRAATEAPSRPPRGNAGVTVRTRESRNPTLSFFTGDMACKAVGVSFQTRMYP